LIGEAGEAIKTKPQFPSTYRCDYEIRDVHQAFRPVKIRLTSTWKIYQGDVKAVLLTGTYSLTENRFVGSQSSPSIDTQGPNPGPAWKLLDYQPDFPSSGMVAIIFAGIRDEELDQLGALPISILPR